MREQLKSLARGAQSSCWCHLPSHWLSQETHVFVQQMLEGTLSTWSQNSEYRRVQRAPLPLGVLSVGDTHRQ